MTLRTLTKLVSTLSVFSSAFIFVLPAFSMNVGEALKSRTLKKTICEEIQSNFEGKSDQHLFFGRLDPRTCPRGTFTVDQSAFDTTLQTVTMMVIDFKTKLGLFDVSGSARVGLSISTDRQGVISKSWKVLESKVTIDDPRSVEAVLQDYIEFDRLNLHNGGVSLTQVGVTTTIRSLQADLRAALKDNEEICGFVTESNTAQVLAQLEEYAPELAQFLERQRKLGNITMAVSRSLNEGESEACSYYYYEIVTKGGLRMSLQFDFTT